MADLVPLLPSTILGAAGEPCAVCGATLAGDQRYCLNCGTRRAESRVPFPAALTGAGAAPSVSSGAGAGGAVVAAAGGAGAAPPPGAAGGLPVAAGAQPPAKAKRSWADRDLLLPVLGTGLLAIAVGILIGRSGASDTFNTKAPVVNVAPTAGAAAAAPAATTADASTDAGTSGSATSADTAAKDKKAPEKKVTAPPATASQKDLENNAKLSGKDYVEKSKKLPPTFSTGGTAPPKDDKPAGGGADAETIG